MILVSGGGLLQEELRAAMSEANREKGCDEFVRMIAVVAEKVRLARKNEHAIFLTLEMALLGRLSAPRLISPQFGGRQGWRFVLGGGWGGRKGGHKLCEFHDLRFVSSLT